jgi:hypothetical protein
MRLALLPVRLRDRFQRWTFSFLLDFLAADPRLGFQQLQLSARKPIALRPILLDPLGAKGLLQQLDPTLSVRQLALRDLQLLGQRVDLRSIRPDN